MRHVRLALAALLGLGGLAALGAGLWLVSPALSLSIVGVVLILSAGMVEVGGRR